MPPEKSDKDKKKFRDEKIRAKAYQIWEKNPEQSSEEDNWNAAIKALKRERLWRPFIVLWRWTGLGEKKGWDIVTGLSIPVVVFVGGIWFNSWNSQQQQEVAEQKQKDELLKTYLNDMKGFLLDEKHPLKDSSKNDESKSIARAITLTTLTQLNSEKDEQRSKEGNYNKRKGLVIQFLFEARLIEKASPIISLNTADFNFANLENANLENANLNGANFKNANLNHANLVDANLVDANLYNAYLYRANLNEANLENINLSKAHLIGSNLYIANLYNANLVDASLNEANLFHANLSKANLSKANLENANLSEANLYNANLSEANLYNAKNLTNEQIKSACNWETANQKKIDKIKQDKASDPKTPPDCSMWK